MAGKIGLTGGIGSGKSTAAKLFAQLSVPVISADNIARELTQPGSPYLAQLVELFGSEILTPDGSLDRPGLAQIVFEDSDRRRQLESILHPPTRQRMHDQSKAVHDGYCIMEIPLLIESGQWKEMDRVLVVTCPRRIRIRRLHENRAVAPEKAKLIMDAQISDKERIRHADHLIQNDLGLAELHRQVCRLHNLYRLDFCREII